MLFSLILGLHRFRGTETKTKTETQTETVYCCFQGYFSLPSYNKNRSSMIDSNSS